MYLLGKATLADKQVLLTLAEAGIQPLDATLAAIAALTGAADRAIYFTGADVAALFTLTAAGRALLDDADSSAQLTTLGVSTFIKTLLDDADAATARGTLGVTRSLTTSDVLTTSGTTAIQTGISANCVAIDIGLVGVSTNGTSAVLLQIGDSGGLETASYIGGVDTTVGAVGDTQGFRLVTAAANASRTGHLRLTKGTGNGWYCSGNVFDTANTVGAATSGFKSLSGTLDRVGFVTANGTDTFDAGSFIVTQWILGA